MERECIEEVCSQDEMVEIFKAEGRRIVLSLCKLFEFINGFFDNGISMATQIESNGWLKRKKVSAY